MIHANHRPFAILHDLDVFSGSQSAAFSCAGIGSAVGMGADFGFDRDQGRDGQARFDRGVGMGKGQSGLSSGDVG